MNLPILEYLNDKAEEFYDKGYITYFLIALILMLIYTLFNLTK